MQPMTFQQAFELAAARLRAGDLAEAESLLRQILAISPENPAVFYTLFTVLYRAGRLAEALEPLGAAIRLHPAEPAFHCMLGDTLAQLNRIEEAMAAFDQALALRPNYAEAHFRMGNAWVASGQLGRGVAEFKKALEIQPNYVEAASNLCSAFIGAGQLERAIDAGREALALRPDFLPFYRNLGWACRESGRLDEAIAFYREAIARQPNHYVHGDLLYTIHFHPEYGRARLAEEHRRWYEAHALPLKNSASPPANDASPNRRLRVGYVAHQLGDHPLGRFFLSLLTHHDPEAVETYCYCDGLRPDWITEQLKSHAGTWRITAGLSDQPLFDLVRDDRIDVLVDLNMHTQGNRLLTFARKPAPVQVTYLAYPGTTGLPAIDYRFTDPYLEAPSINSGEPPVAGAAQDAEVDNRFYAERSWPLPQSYWCYMKPLEAPSVGPLPAKVNGFITFGCLNDYAKVTPSVRALWARLLLALPTSRLLLHAKYGSHRERAIEQFAGEGVDPARLEFAGRLPLPGYFAFYNRIDIALDPFPWAGGATTCDALWMGAPVVALVGEKGVSRGGLSILSNIGLEELAATNPEQYLDIAHNLARDIPRLNELRASMRARMESSPLMDGPGFARAVEAAYREMWHTWCRGGR